MFSVVVPCHDACEALEKVLAGFVNQRGAEETEFEVLLVDNNSREEDIDEVYRKYVERLALYLVRQPRLPHPFSLCRARNVGLRLARHPWIVTLDADCVPAPIYLANLRRHVERNGPCMVAGERIFVEMGHVTDDELLAEPHLLEECPRVASVANYGQVPDRRLRFLEHRAIAETDHPWAYMHGGNCAFPREAALRISGYDEAYDGCWGYEDIDFAHRLLTRTWLTPHFSRDIPCFHQEPVVDKPARQRLDKKENPNWRRICSRIPGYEEYKRREYGRLNPEIDA